jgi:hypothetical protein
MSAPLRERDFTSNIKGFRQLVMLRRRVVGLPFTKLGLPRAFFFGSGNLVGMCTLSMFVIVRCRLEKSFLQHRERAESFFGFAQLHFVCHQFLKLFFLVDALPRHVRNRASDLRVL